MPSSYNELNASPFPTRQVSNSDASELEVVLNPQENPDLGSRSIFVPDCPYSPTFFYTFGSSEDENISDMKSVESLFSISSSLWDLREELSGSLYQEQLDCPSGDSHFRQIPSDAESVYSSITPTAEEDSSIHEPEILIEVDKVGTVPTLECQHSPSYASHVSKSIKQGAFAGLHAATGYVQFLSSNLGGALGSLMQSTSNALYSAGSYAYNSVVPISSGTTSTEEDSDKHGETTGYVQFLSSNLGGALGSLMQSTSNALYSAGSYVYNSVVPISSGTTSTEEDSDKHGETTGYVQFLSSNLGGALGSLMQSTSNALYSAGSYVYNSSSYTRFRNYLGNGINNMKNGFSSVGKEMLSSAVQTAVNSTFPESTETLQNLNRAISGINNAVTHLQSTSKDVSAAAAAVSETFNGTSLHLSRLFSIFMEFNSAISLHDSDGILEALENMSKQIEKLQALCLLKSDTQDNYNDKLLCLDHLAKKIVELSSVAKQGDTLYSWDRNRLYDFLELDKLKKYFLRSSNIQDTIGHMHGVIPRVRRACVDTSNSANSISVISENIKLFSLIGSVQVLPLAAFVLRCSVNQDNSVVCAVLQALAVTVIFALMGRYFQEARLLRKSDNNDIASDHASVVKVCNARTIMIAGLSALPIALITLGIYTADTATAAKTHIALLSTLFVLSLALSIVLPIVYKIYPQRQGEAGPYTSNPHSGDPDNETPSTSLPSSDVTTPGHRMRLAPI
ncbi:hypothetical protein [Neorickettsia sennetsu]|uniref:hypothetical protein n=1 Tax=Ehrlichia sennetsu TaxID=951 RepID=UPI0012FE9411|nr:hypothetical protein [Neorickettsia sennetsu]